MTSCFWQGLLTALGSRGSTRTHRDVKEKAAFSWFSLLSVLFIDRLSFLLFSPLCVIEDVLHSFHSATFSPFLLQSSREKCASLFSDLDLAGVEPSILCHGSIFILCLNSPVERQIAVWELQCLMKSWRLNKEISKIIKSVGQMMFAEIILTVEIFQDVAVQMRQPWKRRRISSVHLANIKK